MSPFDRAPIVPLRFSYKLCVYLVPFSSYRELFVKTRRFQPTPPAFGAAVGVTSIEFRGDLWRQKTRFPALSCGVACLTVLIQYRRVTDGRTEGHMTTANTALA